MRSRNRPRLHDAVVGSTGIVVPSRIDAIDHIGVCAERLSKVQCLISSLVELANSVETDRVVPAQAHIDSRSVLVQIISLQVRIQPAVRKSSCSSGNRGQVGGIRRIGNGSVPVAVGPGGTFGRIYRIGARPRVRVEPLVPPA